MSGGENLQQKLERGDFVVTIEIGPPRSASPEDFLKRARLVKGCGDAYNVTDNQTATVRLSSMAGSLLCLREGMEPVMQIACRDRNRLAIQADVLGAAAVGIRNILSLAGDHQSFGSQPDAKNVYDIDSTQELMILKRMRDSAELWGGEKLNSAPDLYLGATSNPFGRPREMHMIRLIKKAQAGAQFIQTQAVFDANLFEEWLEIAYEEGVTDDVKIIAGVIPLKTAKAAEHMAKGVPGSYVPNEIIERMSSAADESAEGMKIATETIKRLRSMKHVSGIHVMPIYWYSGVRPLLNKAGLL